MPANFLIPYGVSALEPGQVSVTGGEVVCPVPFVLCDRAPPRILRLNGDQYVFPEAPDLRTMTDAAAQLQFLRQHLQHFCDIWARPPKLFLDSYFAYVTAQIEKNETPLSEKLAPYGSLFAPMDWALSAPRPLPRAQLLVADEYWPVDFAFWLGDRAVAVLLTGTDTLTAKERARRDALAQSEAELVDVPVAALMRDGADALAELLPQGFAGFWEGETLPSSPFKGTSLDDIVCE